MLKIKKVMAMIESSYFLLYESINEKICFELFFFVFTLIIKKNVFGYDTKLHLISVKKLFVFNRNAVP